MLKTLAQLLGADSPVLRSYLWMSVVYGVLCGLTVAALLPALTYLLAGDVIRTVPWLLALLGGLVLCWVLRHRVERAGVAVGVAILRSGRHHIGDHVARLPVGWFTPQNTSRLSHIVTQGMMTVAQLPAHVLTPVIAGIVTPATLIAVLFSLNISLGMIALLALPLLAVTLAFSGNLARHADAAFQQHFADASQRVVEFAQEQSVLRAFNGEGGGTRWLEQAATRQRQSGTRLIWLSAASTVLNAWVVQAVFAAMLIATVMWANAALPAVNTAVIAALFLTVRFIDAQLEVASYGEVLRSGRAQLDAIRELLAVPPLAEPKAPQAPHDAAIALRNVHFSYTGKASAALSAVNLDIAAGSMTALIGASGSGKTTLVRLIARFFDVNLGSIQIGGVDVRDISSAQLAGLISQIFQDSYLFAGSIADNIRIGKPDASDAELMQAARQAGVDSIVARLPLGMATPVGENGVRLSGGERQRIAIARALIKDAAILLVDEATAALDAENQSVITETLARLHGKRTLVVIAHQLSTIAMADQVAVLEEGRIVELGAPAQLRRNRGQYAQFLHQHEAAQGWRITPASAGEEDA